MTEIFPSFFGSSALFALTCAYSDDDKKREIGVKLGGKK